MGEQWKGPRRVLEIVQDEVDQTGAEPPIALLGWSGESFTDDELRTTREWLRSRANSIEGGTSEIQLNIIAKRVLGLPD